MHKLIELTFGERPNDLRCGHAVNVTLEFDAVAADGLDDFGRRLLIHPDRRDWASSTKNRIQSNSIAIESNHKRRKAEIFSPFFSPFSRGGGVEKTRIRATGNQAQNIKEQRQQRQQQNGGDVFCFVLSKRKKNKKTKKKKQEKFTADLEQSGVNGRASGVRSAARVIASVIDRHLIFFFFFRTGMEEGSGDILIKKKCGKKKNSKFFFENSEPGRWSKWRNRN